MRGDLLRRGRKARPPADGLPADGERHHAGVAARLLRAKPHELRLYDGALPRPVGQRDHRGRARTADGAAVRGGDAVQRGRRLHAHPARRCAPAAHALLGRGRPRTRLSHRPVLHERHLHRVCFHRDLHHRVLRAAVRARPGALSHRVGAVYDLLAHRLGSVSHRRGSTPTPSPATCSFRTCTPPSAHSGSRGRTASA